MKRQNRKLRWLAALGLVGAAIALADEVELHPALIKGTLTFAGAPDSFGAGTPAGALTVNQFQVRATPYPSGGNPTTRTYNTPSPTAYELTVDGGKPSADNPGRDYTPSVYTYFAHPTGAYSYLYVQRNTAVTVKNETTGTPAVKTVDFDYSALRRAGISVQVTGGNVVSYYFYAGGNSGDNQEYYSGWLSGSFPAVSLPSQLETWLAMPGRPGTSVAGVVTVRRGDVTTQWSLPARTLDLSSGPQTASWVIDLNTLGSLAGTVAVTPAGAAVSAADIVYYGVYNTPSQSVSGSYRVSLLPGGLTPYQISLPPGDYDVLLRTTFATPNHFSESRAQRITVPSRETDPTAEAWLPLGDQHGTLHVPFSATGFYKTEDLSHSYVWLSREDPTATRGTFAQSYQRGVNGFVLSVPPGTWRPYRLDLGINDTEDPTKPSYNNWYKYYYSGPIFAPGVVESEGSAETGAEALSLVKSNLYFDVIEADGATAQTQVSAPQATATKLEYAPGTNTLRSYLHVTASAPSRAGANPFVTMIAEPGTYTLDARATVNGTVTRFPGTTIKFAVPVETSSSNPTPVLTPPGDTGAVVSVAFGSVTKPGVSTMVETPIGPEVPEGFRAYCPPPEDGSELPTNENGDPICPTTYYDIKTTAEWSGKPVVCIQFKSEFNGIDSFLRLYHFDEQRSPAPDWVELDPPAPETGIPAFISCEEPGANCDCAREPNCGITDLIGVYKICGETDGFSPYALLQREFEFTNVVDGVTYTGRTGPIQRWTVPTTGPYRITATGASGGRPSLTPALAGGCGAEVSGVFELTEGDTLDILVGQQGGSGGKSSGGGGGTFVVRDAGGTPVPLVIAGGGGGVRYGGTSPGRDASTGTAGVQGSTTAGYTSGFIAGGTDGLGGARVVSYGAGGGGWAGNGAADSSFGEGGFAFLAAGTSRGLGGLGKGCLGTGGVDRADGGFGGGGSGNGCYGGGGGGGYSGGGGGRVAGGGGSYNAGLRPDSRPRACTASGHGSVKIDLLSQ